MADQSVRGRFVWHELVTPDADAAHAFYGKAIGWKSQPWEEDSSYVMFAAPRGPIGATVKLDAAAPHWLPYVGTDDIDKTVSLAKQKGGLVMKEVDTLSSGSRYAVLQDPYGASFGVYESAENYGKITPPKAGEHSWHELMSSNHEAAFDFYAELFGWEKLQEHDMGPMGTYLIYGLKGEQLGGMMKSMEGAPGAAWLSYVHVEDVNQTAKKVKSAGGQIINGPMEVPGGDWIIAAVDPQGAMFAAHASAATMKNSGKKSAKKQKQPKPEQLTLAAESPPPSVEDPETPANEEAPPADKPSEEPARKAPAKKAPARKAPAKEAPPATEAPTEDAPAKQAPAKKSPAKKAPAKKAPAKKAPAKKSTRTPAKKSGGKKSGKAPAKKSGGRPAKKSSKKRPAAKGAGSKKTAAKKGAKTNSGAKAKSKTRSGGKKKAVKKPRKGK